MERARVLLYVGVCATACYNPRYQDCAVTCGDHNSCPSGLACDMAVNACREQSVIGTACNSPPPIDGSAGDGSADAPACWGIVTSNFDACTLGMAASSLDVEAFQTADTVAGTIMTSAGLQPFGTVISLAGGRSARFVHLLTLTVGPPGELRVQGDLPLIIAADSDITIAGIVDATGAAGMTPDPDCPSVSVDRTQVPSNGGFGGGYGGHGGAEGAPGNGVPIITVMAANGDPSLIPLRPGCPGTTGGYVQASPGTAGLAGGGLQLTSHTQITATSYIASNGGGGGSPGANAASTSGGGGGGAGGSILLEAPMLVLAGANVCAVGGGGGQGTEGNTGSNVPGSPGGFDCGGGSGGMNTALNGGYGGAGAGTSSTDGIAGGTGKTSGASGGGGGGSVGRIRLHGNVASPPAKVWPTPAM